MNLDSLKDITGLIAGVLVGQDGLALAYVGDGGESLAAEISSLNSNLSRISTRMGAGSVTRIAFTSERVEVVAVTNGTYTLGVAIARGNDTSQAQQILAKLAAEFGSLPAGEE